MIYALHMHMSELEIPSRLRQLMHRAGMSMDELAKAMGYARASSIQRYLTDGEYKKKFISADLAEKFEAALVGKGKPPIARDEVWDMAGAPWPKGLLKNPQATIESSAELRPLNEPLTSVKVIGKVAANTWMDVDAMDFTYDDLETLPTLGGIPPEWQFALVVEGKCLNRVANHGDKLICLDLVKAHASAQPEDLVIVERRRFSGQMVERTAKRLKKSAKGMELWPESFEPEHQEPIALYEPNEEVDVRIVAKVLWVLRKP